MKIQNITAKSKNVMANYNSHSFLPDWRLFFLRILCVILFIFLSKVLFADDLAVKQRRQHTYVDAKNLSELYTKLKKTEGSDQIIIKKSIAKLLGEYNWEIDKGNNYILTNILKIDSLFKINDNQQNSNFVEDSLKVLSISPSKELFSGNFSALVINTASKLIDKRAKEELMYYAIDDIFKIAKDTNSHICQIFNHLLPRTRKLVQILKQGGNYYYSDLILVRQTMEIDLRDLPGNFYKIVPRKQPEIRDGLYLSGRVYSAVVNGERLTDWINELGESDAIWQSCESKKVSHILQLLANAFTTPLELETKNFWLSEKEVADLDPSTFKTNLTQQFFYGLLIQQFGSQCELAFLKTEIKSNTNLRDFLEKVYKLKGLGQNMNILYDSINKPHQSNSNWYKTHVNQFLDVIGDLNSNAKDIFNDQVIPASILKYSNSIADISSYIDQKKYPESISMALNLLITNSEMSPAEFRKIYFFVQLANTKDEKGLEDFIGSFAPIGSSSLKRNAKFNLSINGYAGVNGGYEQILNSTQGEKKSGYFGVSAPIGLSLSFCPSDIGSWSGFISVIDLGSLVNARFKGDSTNYSNLRFDQFFSPGVGIGYNFKGTPLTIMANGNWLFNLRDIQYQNGVAIVTETKRNVFRASLSILIDIPFFTLSNKPPNK